MVYLYGNCGIIKNYERWSNVLNEMFPEIVVLTSRLSISQNLKFWNWRELEARSSRKVFLWSDVSKFRRSVLKLPRDTIVFFVSLDKFCFRVKVTVIESAYIHTWMSIYASNDQVSFLWQNDFNECRLKFFISINHKSGCVLEEFFLLI